MDGSREGPCGNRYSASPLRPGVAGDDPLAGHFFAALEGRRNSRTHIMSTRRHRKLFRYPPSFKQRAVEVTLIPGVRSSEVARALQIHPKMLGLWRAQAQKGELLRLASQASASAPARRRRCRVLNAELELIRQEQAQARLREIARWFMEDRRGGYGPGTNP